jgi:hypothetical protein
VVYWNPRNLVPDAVAGPLRKTASIGFMDLKDERALSDTLACCPVLEELALYSIKGKTISDTLDRLTCAPTLTHLTIKDCRVSERSLMRLVQRCPLLTGVFLERAEFVYGDGEFPDPANALPAFALEKVHCPSLRALVLADTIVDPEEAIDFIERHPKLLSFHAVFTDTDARFFEPHIAQVLNMLAPRRAEMDHGPSFEHQVASELARYHGKGLKRYGTFPRLDGVDLSSLPLFDAALDYARFLPSPPPEGAAAAPAPAQEEDEPARQPRNLAQEMVRTAASEHAKLTVSCRTSRGWRRRLSPTPAPDVGFSYKRPTVRVYVACACVSHAQMPHQGLHGFLESVVFPTHFGEGATGEHASRGGVSVANLRAVQRGIAVMNGLRDHLAWQRRDPGAKKPRDREGFVAKLVSSFREWGLVMVDVEVPVLVRAWDLNTRLDLVVYDRRLDKFFQVEIKVGYPDFTKARGTFYSPFEEVGNSGLNQALAQAVVGNLMAKRDERLRDQPLLGGIYVVWLRKGNRKDSPVRTTLFRCAEWCLSFSDYIEKFLDDAGPDRLRAQRPPPPPKPAPKIIAIDPEKMKRLREAMGKGPPAKKRPREVQGSL